MKAGHAVIFDLNADSVFCCQDSPDGSVTEGIEGWIVLDAFLNLLKSSFDGWAFVTDQELVDFR